MQKFLKRLFRLRPALPGLFFLCVLVMGVVLGGMFNRPAPAETLGSQAAPRRVLPSAIAAQIYQQNPDYPLENHYISSDTGEPASDNTLLSRLVSYHIYIKRRPVSFRVDWKLTMADYLGAFDDIPSERYPDNGLRENPIEDDIAAIERLSPEVRDRMVNAL